MKPTALNAKKNKLIKTPNEQLSQKKVSVCPVIKTASFTQKREEHFRTLTSVLSRHVDYQLVTVFSI